MNCREFEAIVTDFARDANCSATFHEEARNHADSCERCGARLAAERKLSVGLRDMAAELRLRQAPPRIEAALLAAFREKVASLAPASRDVSRAPGWLRWPIPAFGAATAVVAIGLGLLLTVDRLPRQPPHETAAAEAEPSTQSPEPVVLPPVSAPKGIPPGPASTPMRVAQSPRSPRSGELVEDYPSSPRGPREITTEFFPLVYGEPFLRSDEAHLVRVRVPRSSLARFGFFLGEEFFDQAVPADVLLGQDGTARAIRFVRPAIPASYSR